VANIIQVNAPELDPVQFYTGSEISISIDNPEIEIFPGQIITASIDTPGIEIFAGASIEVLIETPDIVAKVLTGISCAMEASVSLQEPEIFTSGNIDVGIPEICVEIIANSENSVFLEISFSPPDIVMASSMVQSGIISINMQAPGILIRAHPGALVTIEPDIPSFEFSALVIPGKMAFLDIPWISIPDVEMIANIVPEASLNIILPVLAPYMEVNNFSTGVLRYDSQRVQ
jgi:hypothetical protein